MAGYRQLEKAYDAGKIKAIGISNFHGEKLKNLLEQAEIKPHVIQLEAHPYCTENEIMKELEPYGTRLMSWYPLGHGDKNMLEEDILLRIGQKYGKSSAQVILRWHTQMGFIVIPGSVSKDHIRDNFNIFDFTLTEEEMKDIAKLNKNVKYYNPTLEEEEAYREIYPDMDGQK